MIIIISTNLHTSHMIAKKKFWNLYVHICTWSKRTYCKLLLFTVYTQLWVTEWATFYTWWWAAHFLA